ncbi:MAG: dihydropteroate synthase [Bacteroides sp.]|nr:dihydropteroate synthase [Bacteroides sp.]MCM1379170.1 dihydropteroate synthase [Bacteroides sp.]MCM1445181.1 dihydropteroate synthase [Prevotella sp.]
MPKFVAVKRFSLNLNGRLYEYDRPTIMAIINATPDSFYSGARNGDARQIERAIEEGADILDLGGCSTRPGAPQPSADEEWQRLEPVLITARRMTNLPISVDTYRASVARRAIDCGADIINDISGGLLDPDMDSLIASTRVPYILMHSGDTPSTLPFLARRINELEALGVKDIIVDPGFGFGKDVDQNYELLHSLRLINDTLNRPMLVGLSRKSMFYKPLGLTPEDVLPATCGANLLALQAGAAILRVHDVAPARQICFISENSLYLHNV